MSELKPIQNKAEWVDDAISRAQSSDAQSRHFLSGLIIKLYRYRRLRKLCSSLCNRLERGHCYSGTLRDMLAQYHGVTVGKYSYGPVMRPGVLPEGTSVGAYCSVGSDLIVRRRNHPAERLTQHAFFYNHKLGYVKRDTIEEDKENPLTIGHDVWIGDRVTVLAKCSHIGNGAIIAAGCVVTKDVPPYAIVAGVPAKMISMRFESDVIEKLEASRWWEKPVAELLQFEDQLVNEVTDEFLAHLLS